MLVKMLVSRASSVQPAQPGDIIDVPQDEAIRMIDAGQCEPVREARKPEKATRKRSSERAVQ